MSRKQNPLEQAFDAEIATIRVRGETRTLDAAAALAAQERSLGHFEAAARIYADMVAAFPEHAASHINLGSTLHELRRYEQALPHYAKALALSPAHPLALYNQGLTLAALGRNAEALASFDKATLHKKDFAEAHHHRGNILQALKRHEEALISYDKVLELTPGSTEAWNDRGNALQAMKRYEGALASYACAIAHAPDFAEPYNNRGNVLKTLNRHEEALDHYNRAITLRPGYAEAYSNRGIVRYERGQYEEALADFNKALALCPQYAEAEWNKSFVALLQGNYKEGWALYESRWKAGGGITPRAFEKPFFPPGLSGGRVLVHAEQGYGDTLQFCRYVPLLAERHGQVIFEVYDALVPLLQHNFPGVEVVGLAKDYPGSSGLPPHDYHVPLMSLPHCFGTTLETIPPAPYLKAQPDYSEKWKPVLDKLLPPGALRIGLCWAGGQRPDRPDCLTIDAKRSLKFHQIQPLLDIPNASFVSLQLGPPASERNDDRVKDLSSSIESWSDTAAIISLLDLVVSVDTSVAHLAGAMGTPVYLLNRYDTCWRWLLERDDSPWYPSLTQFRQPAPGQWQDVIERVRAGLANRPIPAMSVSDLELFGRAVALHQAGNLSGAEAIYQALNVSYPNDAHILFLLGSLHAAQDRPEKAMHYMEEAIKRDPHYKAKPEYADVCNNYGMFLWKQQARYHDALLAFDTAATLNPLHAEAQLNRGFIRLTLGEFETGWPLYEFRCQLPGKNEFNPLQPVWSGKEPLQGKTILLHQEQGWGDAIQFCRYVPQVEALGAKIILGVRSPLAGLLSTLKSSFRIVTEHQPLPEFDLHCPLMSLPLAFGTTLATIPADVPYLYADSAKARKWQARLGKKTKPRIGLVWSGARGHTNDRDRSIPFHLLASVLRDDFEFHSLQKEIRPEDEAFLKQNGNIQSHTGDLGHFDDTAALIAAMDLVISVDTSVAHLAGALGKPLWLLLPFVPDFRWLLGRDDSPWYPTMRLFRQPTLGDWESVIAHVKAELETRFHIYHPQLEHAKRLHQAENLIEAERLYRSLLVSDPQNGEAMALLATIDAQRGNYPAAIAQLTQAIALKPDHPEAYFNRALALQMLDRYQEALQDYERAIAADPEYVEAIWHKSLIQLTLGQYKEGWRFYESRWKRGRKDAERRFLTPLLTPGIIGGRVLVHAEQGYGDTLQFCRYVPLLAERHGQVIFEVYDALVPLLQHNFPGVEVVGLAKDYPGSSGLPPHDYHVPLMSLPHCFGTTLETIPPAPYLKAQPDYSEKWKPVLDKLLPPGALRIGLCWAGGQRPDRPDCLTIDAKRSLKFHQIQPLLDIPNASFVSLQLGPPASERNDDRVKDLSSSIESWSDTAAIISLLDLVISVDTSVAHLAGAMGTPVYLLNRYDTCWRWLLNRDDSPWYPSLTQFRQPAPGQWQDVIRNIKTWLENHIIHKD